MRFLALLVAFSAAACGGSDLSALPVDAKLFASSDPLGQTLFAGLSYDGTQKCFTFGDLHAKVNGVSVPVGNSGPFTDSNGGTGCHFPAFEVDPAPVVAQVVIEVTDGTRTIQATYASPCLPRTLTVVSPSDGVMHQDQAVTIQWSPLTDQLGPLNGGEFQGANRDDTEALPPITALSGNRIQFTVPGGYEPGLATISLSDLGQPAVLDCEGISSCTWNSALTATARLPYQ